MGKSEAPGLDHTIVGVKNMQQGEYHRHKGGRHRQRILEQADFALDQFLRHTLFGGSGLFLFDHLLLKRLFGPGRCRLLVFFEQHGS